jgi:hypothetical protein
VDDYLVNSIVQPTNDPHAGEVYYRCTSIPTLYAPYVVD